MLYTLKNKIQKIHWDALGRDATPEELNKWMDFVMAGNPDPKEQYSRINSIKSQLSSESEKGK
jgi:hypothetical protein